MSPTHIDQPIQDLLTRKKDTFREEMPPENASVSVERATRYIHDHLYETHLNVAQTLDACDLQNSTFSQRFRLEMGRTPHEYIQRRRIEAARALLDRGVENLFLVSMSVGYARYRTFLRNFKEIVGCPPSDYLAGGATPIR
jgi:AraC-like DNA-binding protein